MLPRPPVLSDVGGHLSRSRATATPTQRKSKHVRVYQAGPRATDAPGVRCDAALVAHAATTANSSCSAVNPSDLAAFCAANRINISFAQEVRQEAAAAAGLSSTSVSTSTSEADFESLVALDPLQAASSTIITVGRVPIAVPLVTVPQAPPAASTTSSSTAAEDVLSSTHPVQLEASSVASSSYSAVQGPSPEEGHHQQQQHKPSSKLSAASAEFYPRGYITAAAVAAVAVAASNATSNSSSHAAAEAPSEPHAGSDVPLQQVSASSAAADSQEGAAEAGMVLVTQPCPPSAATAAGLVTPPHTPVAASASVQPVPALPQQQQQAAAAVDGGMPMGPYAPTATPVGVPPMAHMVLQPVFYHPGGYYPVMPPQAMLPGPPPPAAAAGVGHGEAPYYQQQQQQMVPMMVPGPMQPQGQPLAMQQVVPYSPLLPADTASLMGAAHSSLASWDLDHEANDDAYSTTSSIAASSTAGGLPWAPSSAASISSRPYVNRHPHPHHQQPRYGRPLVHADDVVTVSALSSVKDAAGAVAKVLQRSAGGLLLALHRRPSDAPAAASLLAVKTLAVARFYINSRMAAMGTAGVSAAAALLGLNPAMQQQEGCAAAPSQQQQEGQNREEVVFIPFSRPISHQQVGAPLLPAADGQRARYQQHQQQQQQQHQQGQGGFGFLLGKVGSSRVPVALPAPVGMPACMQQQATGEASSSAAPAATTPASSGAAGAPLLLKAGGRTDANKLCAALVHHLVSQGRVAVQLAGAPACQVVLSALVAARQRLLRRFRCGLVAVASFATEDTSSELGRSTVFLRLDVMRCEAEGELLGPGATDYLPLAMA